MDKLKIGRVIREKRIEKVYYIFAGNPAFCFTEIHLQGCDFCNK